MANAGSGKTTTLVNRVARLLLSGSKPGAVLCLTFTKAAAAEMQRRLYETLGEWAVADDARLSQRLAALEERAPETYDAADLSRARALFARALETPGGLKIQTIHAFCEQLLRRFPVEAGVSPLFRVVDEAEAAAIRRRARDRVAEQSLTDETPGLSNAYAEMAGKLAHADFEAMFDRFEMKRAELMDHVARDGGLATLHQRTARAAGLEGWSDPEDLERAALSPPGFDAAAWLDAAAVAAGCKQATAQKMGRDLQAVAEAVLNGEAPVDLARTIFFTDAGGPRARLGVKDMGPAALDWLAREQQRLAEAFDAAKAARVAADTVSALILAYAYAASYEDAKAATGALDFSDLIDHARHLLTEGPGAAWVLYKLDGGVDHVLVDEAQDTSPQQWDIVRALTAEFFTGDGARERMDRTVFVVGDEKQSIFSFQGAAPERLLAESQTYADMAYGAEREFVSVPLVHSWRSSKEILSFVDAVFNTHEGVTALSPGVGRIGDPGPADEGGHVRGIEHLSKRADGLPGTIDVWTPVQDVKDEERRAWDEPLDAGALRGARREVAERIAAEIRAMVEGGQAVHDKRAGLRPMDWGDVLILVRKRGAMFEEVLRALKKDGAPVAGADRLVLSAHPVFQDLLALGRAALHPADDLTLAGVLRSPLCDVSEDALFALAHDRPGTLWAALNGAAVSDPVMATARDLIAGFADEAAEHPPFDLYGRLLNRRDGRGLTVRQRFLTRLGAEAGDALDAFLDQARAAEGRGATDLERFCHQLAALDQTIKREMDEPRGEVRVMTAHSSKGLEAPVVILPDVIFSEPRGDALLETEGGGFLWCASSADDCAASATAREARKRRGEEESLRLLYVGLTRARDRLIVTGRYPSNRKLEAIQAWWGPVNAALARLEGVREIETERGAVRRFGADPRVLPVAAKVAVSAPAVPGWLEAAPAHEASERRVAPGQIQDRSKTAAPSPLARVGAGSLGRWRRGDLIHRLLERLPDLAPDRRAEAARALLARESDLDEDQRAEMIAAAFGVLDDPAFSEVFGPGSRAEAALSGTAPELPPGVVVSARLDRLVVTPERVLVVDFKTNRPAPDRAEDADPAYVRQLAFYWAVLRRLYPGRTVEAALVWTDGPKLTPVPEALMRAALEAR